MRTRLTSLALLLCSQAWALGPIACRPINFESTGGTGTIRTIRVTEVSSCMVWTCPVDADHSSVQLAFARNDKLPPSLLAELTKIGTPSYPMFNNLLSLATIDACSTEGRSLWSACAAQLPDVAVKALCP
jgi:hypothetical protein